MCGPLVRRCFFVCEGVCCVLLGATTSAIPISEIPASSTAGTCVFLLCIFSVFVQMAEGATFSIVPNVSRAALGIVSGIVGAGGNLGSVVTQATFFTAASTRTDAGFEHMGYAIIGASLLCALLYFPRDGGLLLPSGLKYDPQLIKPPATYRGSDQMDYGSVSSPVASSYEPAWYLITE